MIKQKVEQVLSEKIVDVDYVCDMCGKVYNHISNECFGKDHMETQEFLHIRFVGGYESVFGDMTRIECDICQHCLLKMIDGHFREVDGDDLCSKEDEKISSNKF